MTQQTTKKTFKDITVFYPQNEDDYVLNVDFNSSVFESTFTKEISGIYIDYIFEQLQEGNKVFAWNITLKDIPLVIEILSRNDTAFMFIFTSDIKCMEIVSNVLIFLKLDNKCNVTHSDEINIDMDNVIYIGVDEIPIEKTDNKIAAIVVILINKNDLKLHSNKKMELIEKKFKKTSIFIHKNIKEVKYPLKKEYTEYQSLAESDVKRPEPKKIDVKSFIDKQKKTLKPEPPQYYTSTLKVQDNYDEDDLILKGDKYQDVHRIDLSKAHKNHPVIGGWIQVDDGNQNFYLFGVKHLKSPSEKLDKSSEKYKKELSNYIVALIELFNPYDNIDIKKFVSDKHMPLWIKTWTHESFDIVENYEALETLGDSYFASSLLSFLFEKYNDIDRAEMSALKANIASKGSLRQIGWSLKMDEWLRMGSGAISNTHTAEDIVEAFCATLQIVANDVLVKNPSDEINIGPNKGITFVRAFIDFLFSSVEISTAMFAGPSKTSLLQSVQGILENKEQAIIEDYENGSKTKTHVHKITLTWSDKALDLFRQNRIKIKKFIASGEGNSQKAITDRVYTLAIENLKAQGYPIEFFEDFKYELQMSQFDENILKKVISKARKQLNTNKIKIKFYTPKTLNTKKFVTVMLLAVVDDGSRKGKPIQLAKISSDQNDAIEAKKKLLDLYLK